MQLFEKKFEQQIERLTQEIPQAILLEGVDGHSATYEAECVAEALRNANGGTIRVLEKQESKTVIGIEQIQALYLDTRTKQSSGYNIWVIKDAQFLSENAQDAFLKLLEEPPASVIFILAVNYTESMLPTIQSRCRVIRSLPFDSSAADKYLQNQDIDGAAKQQLLFLAEGSSSELLRLGNDANYRESRLAAAATAKTFINGNSFEKITLISQLAADREKALSTIKLSLRMLLTVSTKQAHETEYAVRLAALSHAHEQLMANRNVRIQMLKAALQSG